MIVNICNNEEIKKLFFVVATGRSGSNMLIELLNSIRNAFIRMELQVSNTTPVEPLEAKENIQTFLNSVMHIPKDKRNYITTGCKLLDTHVWLCNADEALLTSFPYDVKIIHLYRKNVLDQFLSLKLAQKNNKWISMNHKDGTYVDYDIHVDIDEFKKYEAHKKKKYEEYLYKFPGAYIVDYESLVDNVQEVFNNGLFDYLEEDQTDIMFKTRKQNKKTREEIISNIVEVRHLLSEYL